MNSEYVGLELCKGHFSKPDTLKWKGSGTLCNPMLCLQSILKNQMVSRGLPTFMSKCFDTIVHCQNEQNTMFIVNTEL